MDPVNPLDAGHVGAYIGKSVTIKGELSGSENLVLDGEVEGSIHLDGHSLTIGQNGRVRAQVKAKDIVVQGRVDGNIQAGDRLDLRKSAMITGDILAQRIAVEDGAFLKGKIETTKEARPEPRQSAAGAGASAVTTTAAGPVAAVPVAERKQ